MRISVRAALAGAALTIAVSLLSPSPAAACSICRCGDPTFNALGTDVYTQGAFRLALDWERFEKEQGIFHGEEPDHEHDGEEPEAVGRESVVENRYTAALSYTFGERVIAVARVPWSSRELTEDGEATSTKDLSDPELYALVRLWSAPLTPGLGRRAWVSLLGGVKTDWGKNDLSEGGERLDEHLQPGTGSSDVFAGLSGLYLFDARSSLFASVQHRWTGANGFDYEYGDLTLLNVGYERKLGQRVDAAAELNFRTAGRDLIDGEGTIDPHTGGDVLYLTPRVILDLGRGLVARLAVQVPVYRDLNGDQKEKAVANVGLTFLF